MRYISLQDAQAGMQLAKEIYDSQGRILMGTGVILTDSYIERLMRYGYAGVYIQDELTMDIDVESPISPELRSEGLECIRNSDIDGCMKVAAKLVEEILSKGKISLDMVDLRNYDNYTHAHSVNVAVIAGVIGMGFGMDETELSQLVTAALLHDLGKLSVPLDILNKPGRLTPEEYGKMKLHPSISYELIKDRFDLSAHVKVAVLFHHENVDGTGYPKGIKGEEHTLYTKILHVADVYDALISKRPYKKPYAASEAAEYMMGSCGYMFDQEVVDMLVHVVPLYPKGTEMRLSDGRSGIVMENAGDHNLRPVIRLFDGETLDLSERENLAIAILPPKGQSAISWDDEIARKQMVTAAKAVIA